LIEGRDAVFKVDSGAFVRFIQEFSKACHVLFLEQGRGSAHPVGFSDHVKCSTISPIGKFAFRSQQAIGGDLAKRGNSKKPAGFLARGPAFVVLSIDQGVFLSACGDDEGRGGGERDGLHLQGLKIQ